MITQQKNILSDSYYFSILRPLYEIQICKIFSNYKKYFGHFYSCNAGRRENYWCKECEKCAFIFLALYPFLKRKQIMKIFGQDLFRSPVIMSHISRLCLGPIKPFECVGTKEECILALALAVKKNPSLLAEATINELYDKIRHIDVIRYEKEYLETWNRRHNFPQIFSKPINNYLKRQLHRHWQLF